MKRKKTFVLSMVLTVCMLFGACGREAPFTEKERLLYNGLIELGKAYEYPVFEKVVMNVVKDSVGNSCCTFNMKYSKGDVTYDINAVYYPEEPQTQGLKVFELVRIKGEYFIESPRRENYTSDLAHARAVLAFSSYKLNDLVYEKFDIDTAPDNDKVIRHYNEYREQRN